MSKTLASTYNRTIRSPATVARRRYSLAALRGILAVRREQARFRWDLKRMSEVSSHLIDDIGLTKRRVEEEIAKLPFWQR